MRDDCLNRERCRRQTNDLIAASVRARELGLPVSESLNACVLLFGSHVSAMPVDTLVHRVSLRLGIVPPRTSPEATTDVLEAALQPRDYFAFHVNVIRLGREVCQAPRPRYEVCPLSERCGSSQATVPGLRR